MTEESPDLHLDAGSLRARDAVRQLGQVEADPAYRARLRSAFVQGRIESAATRAPARTRRTYRWTRLAPIAAAAAIVVLLLAPYLRGTALTVVSVEGARQIVLNGKVVSCDDLSPIQAALQPGCRIEVPDDAVVEVAGAGQVLMDLQGIEFTFPARPHPVFGGGHDPRISGEGTVRLATAPGFTGGEYRLQLDNAEIMTRGSVFTVSRRGDEIGINVLEGQLEARLPDGTTAVIGPRSGGMIRDGEFVPMEYDGGEDEPLQSLRDRAVVI